MLKLFRNNVRGIVEESNQISLGYDFLYSEYNSHSINKHIRGEAKGYFVVLCVTLLCVISKIH